MAVRLEGSPLWRILDGIMLLLFAFSVVVQVNDPDPLRWIAIYGAAAVACLIGKQLHWTVPVAIGLVALAWAITLAPNVIGMVPFREMFREFEMKNRGVEESREMYGLVLVAGWMAVLAHRAFWRGRRER
jgi:hypothetical protein